MSLTQNHSLIQVLRENTTSTVFKLNQFNFNFYGYTTRVYEG